MRRQEDISTKIYSWSILRENAYIQKSGTYFRYIDDIFLIWTGTENEVDQFFNDLNKKHSSKELDYKASETALRF